ncbi:MAG: hypothetical protein R6U99_11890 [Nioella sp.]
MSQGRGMSALEATVNVMVGWLVAFVTQLAVFPAVGLQAGPAQHLVLSIAFTVVSFVRSYLLRRAFARFG